MTALLLFKTLFLLAVVFSSPFLASAQNTSALCATGLKSGHTAKGVRPCCATTCGTCGETEMGCENREGGSGKCCARSIVQAGVVCATPDDTGCILAPQVCELGITSADGHTCCSLTCGSCGGETKDCHRKPGGAAACCEKVIKKSGIKCNTPSQTGCLIGDSPEKKTKKKKTRDDGSTAESGHTEKEEKKTKKKKKKSDIKEHNTSSTLQPPPPLSPSSALRGGAYCGAIDRKSAPDIDGAMAVLSIGSVAECCDACSAAEACVLFVADKSKAPWQCYLKNNTCSACASVSRRGIDAAQSEERQRAVPDGYQIARVTPVGQKQKLTSDDEVMVMRALAFDFPIRFQQENPKKPNQRGARERYEVYSKQTTIRQALQHSALMVDLWYDLEYGLYTIDCSDPAARARFRNRPQATASADNGSGSSSSSLLVAGVLLERGDPRKLGLDRPVGVPKKDWAAAAAKYGVDKTAWAAWERAAAGGSVEAQLSPELVMGDAVGLRRDRFRALLPPSTASASSGWGVPRGGVVRIFLDHGASSWHQEVFYSVAKKLERAYVASHRATRVEFLIEEMNFRDTTPLWKKHVTDLNWRTVHQRDLRFHSVAPCCQEAAAETTGYRPLVKSKICNRDVAGLVENPSTGRLEPQYHVRAVITGPKSLSFGQYLCLSAFRDDERFVFIMHYPEKHLFSWTNVYMATDATVAKQGTPRTFTPSEMPVKAVDPDCGAPPVFVVQGALERRLKEQLAWVLLDGGSNGGNNEGGHEGVTLRILTRSSIEGLFSDEQRKRHVDYRQNMGMTEYAEAPLGAAFLLTLISPDVESTAHYFRGHPTSSIAYAVNYGLHVVGRRELRGAYADDLRCLGGHYHDRDTRESVAAAVRDAAAAFHRWCAVEDPAARGPWAKAGISGC